MKTSKKERIHPGWDIVGEVDAGKSRFFKYRCRKCKVEVLNGQPFSEVGGMECKP